MNKILPSARRVLGTALLLLISSLVLPAADASGEIVALTAAHLPARTVADHPFPASVTLVNHDTQARSIYLFGALYAPGSSPCGAASDPRFKGYTPLVQARVDLPGGATVSYPSPGDTWLQRYHAEAVPAGDATMEICFFAAEDATPGSAQLRYDDFRSQPLATRGINHAPVAEFVVTTDGESYRFEQQASDVDGDALSYEWRIETAAGPVLAHDPTASMTFPVPGTYNVTLTVSDGFDATSKTQPIHVAEVSRPAQGDRTTPLAAPALTLGALLLALALRRRP